MGFDLDCHLLDILGFNFAFPASLSKSPLDLCATEVLAGSIAFTDLQKSFDSFVGSKAAFAMVAGSTATNSATVFHVSRIAYSVVIVSAKRASHEYLPVSFR
jgi:hypothetical protein